MDSRTDEQLVAAHRAGDREALAGMYDRYADVLHDTAAAMLRDRDEAADAVQDVFLLAIERLHQLRDPSRLKPWLFAIMRNEIYRRTKQRGRRRPVDPAAAESPAPLDPAADAAAIEWDELAEAVRAAAGGLDRRDQLVLELSVRNGFTGADLASALGVTASQSYVLVHRMRDRIARSLGALAVARAGRRDCPELGRILGDWDGTFNVLIRKRVARHVEQCDVCTDTQRRFPPLALFGAAPVIAAPPELRDRVLSRAADPANPVTGGARRLSRRAAVGIAVGAAAALMIVASTIALRRGDDGPAAPPAAAGPSAPPTAPATTSFTTTAATSTTARPTTTVTVETTAATTAPSSTVAPSAPPGALELSSNVIDLGADAATGALTLTNTGGAPASWAMAGDAGPFTISSTSGTVPAGGSAALEVALDRDPLPEGTVGASVVVTSDGDGGGAVEIRARVERAPTVQIIAAPASLSCPSSVPSFVEATIADESALSAVVLSWSGPGDGSGPMRQGPATWTGRLDVELADGTWAYVVTATDERGNVGTDEGSVSVAGCASLPDPTVGLAINSVPG